MMVVAKSIVYVVDDEDVISLTLTMILNQAGFAAHGFTSSAAALAASQEVRPEVLISDVMMPEMTGVQLAIHFRALHPKCRTLLFSGAAQTLSLLDQAEADGHLFDLIGKPVHPADLLAKLRKRS